MFQKHALSAANALSAELYRVKAAVFSGQIDSGRTDQVDGRVLVRSGCDVGSPQKLLVRKEPQTSIGTAHRTEVAKFYQLRTRNRAESSNV
jgi:hypothetical protein